MGPAVAYIYGGGVHAYGMNPPLYLYLFFINAYYR